MRHANAKGWQVKQRQDGPGRPTAYSDVDTRDRCEVQKARGESNGETGLSIEWVGEHQKRKRRANGRTADPLPPAPGLGDDDRQSLVEHLLRGETSRQLELEHLVADLDKWSAEIRTALALTDPAAARAALAAMEWRCDVAREALVGSASSMGAAVTLFVKLKRLLGR